jgi:hypothetical protein
MPADHPISSQARSSAAAQKYWLALVAVIFALAMLPMSFKKPAAADWLNTYVLAGQEMLSHQPIHTAGKNSLGAGPFTYPPAAALLAIPFARTSSTVALAGWYVASVLATFVAVGCAWRLAGAPSFGHATRDWSWIFALGLFLVARQLISPFGNRQTDMFVAAAVLGGCWLLARGRDTHGAVWIGVAAAIKATPLLFAPYLLWRGRWRAASVLVAVPLALNYLPDFVWPQPGGQSYLTQWREISLAPVRSGTPGEWFADRLRNQSIAGLVGRLATFGPITSMAQVTDETPPVTPERARMIKLVVYGICLLLLGITLWRFGWRKPDRSQIAVEFAAVVCLMLLISPMTSKSHLCVLVLPVFLIAREIVQRRTPGWIAFGVALTLLGPLASRDVVGREVADILMAWGLPVMFVLLNLAAMWKLARADNQAISDNRAPAYETPES